MPFTFRGSRVPTRCDPASPSTSGPRGSRSSVGLRVLFTLLAACLIATGARSDRARAQTDRPLNILLIVSDDQRHDTLGAAGHPVVQTPHLDALAADGVRFTEARVTTSICMTSRASILTGQYMSRHGIDRFGLPLTPAQFAETYAGRLRAAGYWSGVVGKYGVGPVRDTDFDVVRAYEGRHWYDVDGERVHVTERNARDALAFLDERPRSRPFVLSVSFFAPHAEDAAPEQYLPQPWSAARYEGRVVPVPPSLSETALRTLPPFLQASANEGRIRFNLRFDTPARYQRAMTDYFRLVTEVDVAVGRIVSRLREQRAYDDTLVVFIGDNGYFHGERMLADKWYPYEEALRVPLIVRDPRLQASERGRTHEAVALNIDVAPTILRAADLDVPDRMQGDDLAPLYLSATPPAWRDEFFYEHPTITNRDRIPTSHGVIGRDVKYVHWPEWDHEQLFDLRADPGELRNVASEPARTATLQQMRARLAEWKAQVR
jgi:arylsulfatase